MVLYPLAIGMLASAAVCFLISCLSFLEKGTPFHTLYFFATNEERRKMNKAPLYRSTAKVFLIATVGFLLLAVECVLMTDWLMLGALLLLFFDCMYAYRLTHKIEYPNGRNWKKLLKKKK